MRVLIVEGDFLVAASLREVVERAGFRVCAVADDGAGALAAAARLRPGAALVGTRLRDGPTGVAVASALCRGYQVVPILVPADRGPVTAAEARAATLEVPGRDVPECKLVDALRAAERMTR